MLIPRKFFVHYSSLRHNRDKRSVYFSCCSRMAAIFEEEIVFDNFTKLALCLFRLAFFDFKPLAADVTLKEKVFYSLRMSYVRLCIIGIFIAAASMTVFGIVNIDDFANASTSVPNATLTLLIGLKALMIFLRKDDIWEIFQDVQKMFDRRNGINKKYEVKKCLDEYHLYIKTYGITVIAFLMPITFPVIAFLLYGTMKLSINYWFPFDVFHRETFPIALIWTEWNGFNLSIYLLGSDAILYALITVIAMEFDFLRIDLMDLGKTPAHERKKRIIELTDHHNKLLSLSNKLQEIFEMIFLYTYVISSLEICFIAFQLSLTTAGVSSYAFYVPYLFMVFGQVFLLSIFGQKMINSSESVADGIHNCGWEDMEDNAFKKQLILILMLAQKSQKFTAMRFATISLSSFTTVGSSMDSAELKLT